MSNNFEEPKGRSEKLYTMVRKTFGDKMVIYADSNGSYTAKESDKDRKDNGRVQI